MNLFSREILEYPKFDTVENDQKNEHACPVEFLKHQTVELALPNHKQKPKKRIIVMVLRNVDLFKKGVSGLRYKLSNMALNMRRLISATFSKGVAGLRLPCISKGPIDDSIQTQEFLKGQLPLGKCFKINRKKLQIHPFRCARA